MKHQKIKRCPFCKNTFKSLSSHLQRSEKCLAKYKSPFAMSHTKKSLRKKQTQPKLLQTYNMIGNSCLHSKVPNAHQHEIDGVFKLSSSHNHNRVVDNAIQFDHMEEDICDHLLDFMEEDICHFQNDYVCDKILSQYFQLQKNKRAIIDPQVIFLSRLLKILHETNAPLYLYEKIVDWAIVSIENGFRFEKKYPSREKLIQTMSKLCCLEELSPKTNQLVLSTTEEITINSFDFEQQCFSLLTDVDLMKDENLSFPNQDPCNYRRSDSNVLECIEDGDMYQQSAKSICKDEKDFCLGIKLFIDATHTDVHSNWMLDPIMFTFTFFKNNVTRSHKAWRTLGFITSTNKKSKAQNSRLSSRNKLQDYHNQIMVILRSIKECQDKGGFKWNLKHRNVIHWVRMIPVVVLIVGDAQGNHKLAGMFGKFFDTARVNHSCSCLWKDTDNPNISCKFINQSYINKLCSDDNNQELHSISQHNIKNAFNNIILAPHVAGLNAMMPSEILHQLFLGIFQYVLTEFFAEFPPKALSRIDDLGELIHQYGKHNSDRSIPSLSSRNGFTTITKKSGSDMIGTMLVCLLMLSVEFRNSFLNGCTFGPSGDKMDKYRNLFEELLIYSEWLNSENFIWQDLDEHQKTIRKLMFSIKSLVLRQSENGLKLSKFHEMMHVTRDIRLFGPPDGYDGRPGESSHKHTKANARKTQRRNDVFEFQTCQRLYESTVIDSFNCHTIRYNRTKTDRLSRKKYDTCSTGRLRSSYEIYLGTDYTVTSGAVNSSWPSSVITKHMEVCNFIYNNLGLGESTRIPCKTMIKVDVCLDTSVNTRYTTNNDLKTSFIFRSNPYMNKEEWYDWAWFRWKFDDNEECDIPGKIFAFVDLEYIDVSEETLLEKGFNRSIYACIRSLDDVPSKLFSESRILHISQFEQHQDKYRLVEINSITNNCYVIPNIESLEEKEYNEWIVLENRYEWGNHFSR